MIESFLQNMTVTLACSFIAFIAKSLFNYIKRSETEPDTPQKHTPKKVLQKQFFFSLFAFLFSFSGAWALPLKFLLLGTMKIFLTIISFYAFLFIWGAFDAAFAFYPEDDPGNPAPPQDAPDDSGENQISSH